MATIFFMLAIALTCLAVGYAAGLVSHRGAVQTPTPVPTASQSIDWDAIPSMAALGRYVDTLDLVVSDNEVEEVTTCLLKK